MKEETKGNIKLWILSLLMVIIVAIISAVSNYFKEKKEKRISIDRIQNNFCLTTKQKTDSSYRNIDYL